MKAQQEKNIRYIRSKAVPILRASGVRRASVFGSAARGELKKSSDIDMLVDIPSSIGLVALVGIKQKLEKALGRKVDLVEYNAIKSAFKKSILKNQIPVL